MSNPPTVEPAAKKPVPFKKKGNPHMSPQQEYKSRPYSRSIKVWTESFQTTVGRKKLTREEKSMLAYFTIPISSHRDE